MTYETLTLHGEQDAAEGLFDAKPHTVKTEVGDVPIDAAQRFRQFLVYMKPIMPFYSMPGVTEIMVNRFDSIFVEENGHKIKTEATFQSNEAVENVATMLALALDQVYDDAHPILHARLPDCSRFCCVRSTIATGGASITIRIAPKTTLTSQDLLTKGAMSQDMLNYIRMVVDQGANIIVSGSTGSGKTTLLRMLAEFIDPELRVITCEDTQELYLNLPNTIPLEAPKRRFEAGEEVNLSTLIKTTLRQAPDRIWVGEIRDAAAADAFLQAINTGHNGCATTIHSNGCLDTVERIQYLLASSGLLSYELTRKVLLGNVNVLIHAAKTRKHGRRITEIMKISNEQIQPLFLFDETKGEHICV